MLHISSPDDIVDKATIVSASGRIVKEYAPGRRKASIKLHGLSPGVYVVWVQTAGGIEKTPIVLSR
jgi:hypothetical protein